MSHLCPAGHLSDTPDFCSVCGAEVGAAATSGVPCPSCGTPRESATQTFCEACGHDFRTRAPGITLELVTPQPPASAPPAPLNVRWDVVVRVDANLYGKTNPDAPRDQPPQTFTLFEAENLIGRDNPGRHLQVPIRNDPGVS